MSGKALFLDRDGTLIVDRNYLADPAGVELIPGVDTALRRARELGYLLFLLTNQSGIGPGLLTLDDARRVNTRVEELLGLARPVFTEICIAPERPDDPSIYRKPSPRFLTEMITRHALEPRECWMAGDKPIDAQTALNAGIRAVLLASGKHDEHETAREAQRLGVPWFRDLSALVTTLQ